MMRAATSVDPPGGNGTISVIGREGKESARAGASGVIKVSAMKANATAATDFRMMQAPIRKNSLRTDVTDENNSSNSIRKHFPGRWTTQDNRTERTRARERHVILHVGRRNRCRRTDIDGLSRSSGRRRSPSPAANVVPACGQRIEHQCRL